jgi:hypothetical protein
MIGLQTFSTTRLLYFIFLAILHRDWAAAKAGWILIKVLRAMGSNQFLLFKIKE